MRVTIIPHGALCETWPSGFVCEANTPHEAFRAYEAQHDLRNKTPGVKWVVRFVGCDSEASLYSPLRSPELHVVPDFSGGGGALKIIIGVIIIIAAIVLSPYTGGTSLTAIGAGLSLVMGGILELLTPAPKTATADPSVEGRYLGNVKNTTKIGTRIPIGYGRFPIYGQYLSFGVGSIPSADPGTAALRRQALGFPN